MAIDKQRRNGEYEKHAEMMKGRDDADDRVANLGQSHRANHNAKTARKNSEDKKKINPGLKQLKARHEEEVKPLNDIKNDLALQLKAASRLRKRN